MFKLAPSKEDQLGLRYWSRNRYKAAQNRVRYCNRAFTKAASVPSQWRPQIRMRPIFMTEDQKFTILRETGRLPFLEVCFVRRARGHARSQTRKMVIKK